MSVGTTDSRSNEEDSGAAACKLVSCCPDTDIDNCDYHQSRRWAATYSLVLSREMVAAEQNISENSRKERR